MPHRIFVVEDHPLMREVLTHFFRYEDGLDLCGIAGTAEEAEARLGEAGCDLLLTDVSLPGMDGIELAARVRQTHPDLPVVVISVNDDAVTAERARAAGARAFLSKAIVADALAGTLRAVLAAARRP